MLQSAWRILSDPLAAPSMQTDKGRSVIITTRIPSIGGGEINGT